jgi:hypothetical protein
MTQEPPSSSKATTAEGSVVPGSGLSATEKIRAWRTAWPRTITSTPITARTTIVTEKLPLERFELAGSKARPARWSPGAAPGGTRTTNSSRAWECAGIMSVRDVGVTHAPAPSSRVPRFA